MLGGLEEVINVAHLILVVSVHVITGFAGCPWMSGKAVLWVRRLLL